MPYMTKWLPRTLWWCLNLQCSVGSLSIFSLAAIPAKPAEVSCSRGSSSPLSLKSSMWWACFTEAGKENRDSSCYHLVEFILTQFSDFSYQTPVFFSIFHESPWRWSTSLGTLLQKRQSKTITVRQKVITVQLTRKFGDFCDIHCKITTLYQDRSDF